ncbi:WD repeat-containing protein 64-like [Bombina bombina]|uniref:WD repeat-containing protein 64-like n=1 Tax=Bombina bombina TaxID=8345 RepID=UPI00235B1364|nr:WD repeat-containing protein 64-like [Bombina bombina]
MAPRALSGTLEVNTVFKQRPGGLIDLLGLLKGTVCLSVAGTEINPYSVSYYWWRWFYSIIAGLNRSSLYSEIRKTSAKPQLRAKTGVEARRALLGSITSEEPEDQCLSPPEWLEKEIIKRQTKRHSLGLLENLKAREILHNQLDLVRSLWEEKIEQKITLAQLQKLKKAFEEYETNDKSMDMEEFKWALKNSMGFSGTSDEQIEKLFMKIDVSATGEIKWDNFCTYLQRDYAAQAESNTKRKEICFTLPAAIQDLPHGEPILRISSMPDNSLVSVQEDGHVYFWSPQLKLKRDKAIFTKPAKKMPKWVTDFTIMTPYNKLVLATGDRSIQLYEISNLEPYCQITGLETMPLKLDYCDMKPDECMIFYGDDKGCVNILLLTSVGETLRLWKKMPKDEYNMATVGIDNAVLSPHVLLIRWKVHGHWVSQIKYFDSIKLVMSASNDESTALVIGCTLGTTNVEQQLKEGRRIQSTVGLPQKRANGDQTVFRIHKGVKTFGFCKNNSLVVTGGLDRIIRTWNLYVPGQPTGMLRGHTAPIFFVHISTADNKIFSVDLNNTVKIWDMDDHSCLFTACTKNSHIRGELTSCLYIPHTKSLYLTTDSIAFLQLMLKSAAQPHLDLTHSEPVLCCKYNKTFRQVVSCSEGSVVKVWDFDTGKPVFEFNDAHGDAAITCITFDLSERRLISGGRDGCLKLWNYNNGQCLHTLKKGNTSDEICDCTYVEINKSKFIVAVGWDRKINMYIVIADNSISKILFLKTRKTTLQEAACLVSNGPQGCVYFWNVLNGGKLLANFTPSRMGYRVSSIAVDKDDALMFVADSIGFIYVYDIKEYALHGIEKEPAKTVNHWRAHVNMITHLEVIKEDNVVLSSSLDCTMRLWSLNGEFIGTFGQRDLWEISTPASWKHPMVPHEILVDPESMPSHPVLEGEMHMSDTVSSVEKQDKDISDNKHNMNNCAKFTVTDSDIQEEIDKLDVSICQEKWLRHEKYRRLQESMNHSGLSIYNSLRCCDLINVSLTLKKPNMSAVGSDPFQSDITL